MFGLDCEAATIFVSFVHSSTNVLTHYRVLTHTFGHISITTYGGATQS